MEAVVKSGRRRRSIAVGRDRKIERRNERLRQKSPNEASRRNRRKIANGKYLRHETGVIRPDQRTQIEPDRLDVRRLCEDATSDSLLGNSA